jgi:3'-phosphoadenosine 5'-phosphosulfate sulfotransferase (PAPS reductase)/FAD synthetase
MWELKDSELERLKRGKVFLSLSGGKDSTACGLFLLENGIEFESLFMDTGWEHPAVYKYIDQVLRPRFGKVHVLKSKKFPGGLVQAIEKKGIFPSRRIRYCTDEFKIKPRNNFFKKYEGESIVSVVGIRRQESERRSKYPRWDYNDKLEFDSFYPLIDHTFEQVIEMHKLKDLEPNPLYLQGMERVGCFPCIYARKSEVSKVADLLPQRIDQIEELETQLTERAKQKDSTASKRVFFGPRVGSEDGGIRQVVEWSKTERGGRQLKLFDTTAQDGCMRWGMCDRALSEDEMEKLGAM